MLVLVHTSEMRRRDTVQHKYRKRLVYLVSDKWAFHKN